MNTENQSPTPALPAEVEAILSALVDAARGAFGDDLKAFILFGSGAEGRLRPASDLNLLAVLKRFDAAKADAFREPLRTARVATRATCMFLLESELSDAMEAFAVKFDDIGRRRRVLYGVDVFAGQTVTRAAKKSRLRQVLLNLILRQRERYIARSQQEKELVAVVAETAGPLRAAAATLIDLSGQPVSSPKEAMEKIVIAFCTEGKLRGGGSAWMQTLERTTQARVTGELPPGVAGTVIFQNMAIAEQMLVQLDHLP